MTAQPPLAERALPPEAAARIRASLLSQDDAARPTGRRWRTALVAAAVALVLIGVAFVVFTRPDPRLVAGPPAAGPGDRVVRTDVGPLGSALTDTELRACRQPTDPAVGEVLYARLVASGPSPISAIVYRNADEQVTLCAAGFHGPTRAGERSYQPSTRYPVVPMTGIVAAGWLPGAPSGTPSEATDYTTFQAFAAAPEVASVQLRAVVAGRPGPWFDGVVHDGFTVVPLVEPGPIPLDVNGEVEITFERRALDHAGHLLAVK